MAVPGTTTARRRTSKAENLPWSIKLGLPLVAALFAGWGLWSLYVGWERALARLALTDGSTQPIRDATIELFAFDDTGSAPVPPLALGSARYEGELLRLGPDQVPGKAIARLRAAGGAIGYAVLELGREEVVVLEPAPALHGTVTAGSLPAAGAEVVAMSEGPPYVPLTSSIVDAHGTFELTGHARSCEYLRLRVLHRGYEVAYVPVTLRHAEPVTVELQPTRAITGRVLVPDGVDSTRLQVGVYNLPGVAAAVQQDGGFSLDHVPGPPTHGRLLVHGLGAEWSHRKTMAEAGAADVVIPIVRAARVSGHVTLRSTGIAVPFASVLHPHGPHGDEVVRTDADGAFTIGFLPPGEVELRAHHAVKRRIAQAESRPDRDIWNELSESRAASADPHERGFGPVIRVPPSLQQLEGFVQLDLQPGEQRSGVVIRID